MSSLTTAILENDSAHDQGWQDGVAELHELIRDAVECAEETVMWPPAVGPAPSMISDSAVSSGVAGAARSHLELDFTQANPEHPIDIEYSLLADGDNLRAAAEIEASLDEDSDPEIVVRAEVSSGMVDGRIVNSVSIYASASAGAGGDLGGAGGAGELGISVDLSLFGE